MNQMISKIGTIALLGVFAATGVLACGDDGDDKDDNNRGSVQEAVTAQVLTNVESVSFSATPIGGESTETLRVFNGGQGTLRISSIQLTDVGDSGELQRGELWQQRAELKQDEFIDLEVVYRPLDSIEDEGVITIESNDPERSTLEIPVTTPPPRTRMFSPSPVTFQRVPPVTEETRDVNWLSSNVQNVGDIPLTINDVVVVGNDFKVTFPDPTKENPFNEDPATDSTEWPTDLQPGEEFPIRVYFNPVDNEPSTGKLIFFTNVDGGQYTVELQGNSGSPCLEINQQDEINFGEGGIGFANNKTMTIKNCSAVSDLEVNSIEVIDDGDGVFEIREGSLPADLPDGDAIIPPNNTANFVLSYTPEDLSVSNGMLKIGSNDPGKPNLEIPITGKGTNNVCPNAVAEARIEDTSRYQQQIRTLPLKVVELRGLNSTDPNGTVESYEWTVISRPANSLARLEPDNTSAEPTFFLDLAGTYVIELVVFDNEGLASCNDDETKQIVIEAIPDEDIHVQLVWDAPAVNLDENPNFGTDLDLHYLHPQGEWNRGTYDIYWRNKTANWGAPGTDDDPRLDIDDLIGAAPENVNHNNPESGLVYQVGAHYYADNGFGPSYATLRIFIGGVQQYEYRDKFLAGTGQFWRAVGISWPSGDIVGIDQLSNGFPN